MVLLFLLATSGCNDEEEYERYPIRVVALEFADTLSTGQREDIVVGAEVGYDRCELENGGLERRGDSLYVRGNARCRVYKRSGSDGVLEPRIATPPARPNPQWLHLLLPEVEPGSYILAGGDLSDTLLVVPNEVPTSSRRMAGLGEVGSEPSACSASGAIFHLDLFRVAYQVLDLPSSELPARVEIHATHAGAATCDSTYVTGALRLRSIVRLKPR